MLVALTAFVCACQPDRARRHLGTVRHCASSRDLYSQAVGLMQKTDAARGVIRRQAGQLTFAGRGGAGLDLHDLHPPDASSSIPRSSPATSPRRRFDPMEIKTGNADLYLILPHDMLVSHQTADAAVDQHRHGPRHQRHAR